MNVHVLLEDCFEGHQGNDLFDPEKVPYKVFRVKKQMTLEQLVDHLAESLVSDWCCNNMALTNNSTSAEVPQRADQAMALWLQN